MVFFSGSVKLWEASPTGSVKKITKIRPANIIEIFSREKKTEKRNKAGYTAISCGRVGRGGNARFHTFRLMLTDGPTDGRTDGGTDGQRLL